MTAEWVTIATFSWLQEALLTKSLLEANGIETFIPEQNVAGVNPFATAMTIRVQVRSDQAELARSLMATPAEPEPETETAAPTCPTCGSDDIRDRPRTGRNWIDFLVGVFFTVPFRRRKTRYCGKCGHILRRGRAARPTAG
jgi:hypothetical protein